MGPKPGCIFVKGQKSHLFAPVLIINAKKMHCYHMALSHFKILTIFGNLQRAVNPSLKWLKRLIWCVFFCLCTTVFFIYIFFLQSKQHFIKKMLWSPVGPRQNACRTTRSVHADFLCPPQKKSHSWLATTSNFKITKNNRSDLERKHNGALTRKHHGSHP